MQSRFIAQAAHIAEVHLGESGLDFGELQLGQATTLDLDIDTFVAGIGYTKQSVVTLSQDSGKCLVPRDAPSLIL